MIDILIPLASTSTNDFLELRIALRSIEKCTNVGNIYVITTANIPWIKNVIKVPVEDIFTDNKDKNLIYKVETALNQYSSIDDFILWCDDFVVLNSTDLSSIPDIYNKRGIHSFSGKLTKWQARLKNTLEIGNIFGRDVSCNWDAHAPVKFNRNTILNGLKHIDYKQTGCNYTIFTLFGHISKKTKVGAVEQNTIKCTCETVPYTLDTSKTFLGYNDLAFNNGLSNELLARFSEESIFERDSIRSIMKVVVFATNATTAMLDSVFYEGSYYTPIVIPLDEYSVENVDNSKYTVVPVINLNTDDVMYKLLTIACKLTDYAVFIDGDSSYDDSYISDGIKVINRENVDVVIHDNSHIVVKLANIQDKDVFKQCITSSDFINTIKELTPSITYDTEQ